MQVRELKRREDRVAVEAIDTGFETDVVFDVIAGERGLALEERKLPRPITKRYSIREVFQPWASWQQGWVAEVDGVVRGFATVEYEPWRERLALWFLYIGPAWRRQGLGRALLQEVERHGREVGATHVWLETSSANVPGVRAYARLGYTLCGADVHYYGKYMPGESAIFLAKPLR
ncbi:MAG: GNAT family N-acetyltransferase [Polyangiales bacterium]